MSTPAIESARDDVRRSRAELSETLNELSARVSEPVDTVKRKVNVVAAVRENPWAALAVAIGAGAFVASSGADVRAASAAASAAESLAEKAADTARQAPSRARTALVDTADAIAVRCALAIIGSLRESSAQRNQSSSPPV